MTSKASFLLVAAASFAVGMAADRLLFSSKETAKKEELRGTTGIPRKSSSGRSDPGATNGPAKSKRDRPHDNESVFPDSVHELIEDLDRGKTVDFKSASKLILAMPPGPNRREAIHRFLSRWGRTDPKAALAWTENLTGRQKLSAMEHVLHRWAEENPSEATNYAATLPSSEHSLHLVREMARKWTEQDRPAALEWSMSQSDGAMRAHALHGVTSVWAESAPAEAAQFAAALESPFERRRVLEVVARRWASQDLGQAMEWAQGLPPSDYQHATRALLRSVAEHDPVEAATLYQEIATRLPDSGPIDREYRHMAETVASSWSSSSPQAAAEWAMGLPERGSIRRGAVGQIAERWMHLDSVAAREWIQSLPAGNTRDGAAERLIHMSASSDPETAFAWAETISDQDHRRGLMHHTLTQWRNTDPAAAGAALSNADVPPEVKRHLSEELGLSVALPPAPAPVPEGESAE